MLLCPSQLCTELPCFALFLNYNHIMSESMTFDRKTHYRANIQSKRHYVHSVIIRGTSGHAVNTSIKYRSSVDSIKCCFDHQFFDQVSIWSCVIRSNVVSIICCSIECRFDHLLLDRISFWLSYSTESQAPLSIFILNLVLSQSNLEPCKLTPGVRTNTEAFSDHWEEIITAVLSF